PNKALQPTPLAARMPQRFWKTDSARLSFRSIDAARLSSRPLGRSHRARTRLKSIITVSFARIAATICGILLAHLFSFVAERAIALAHNCRRISETAL